MTAQVDARTNAEVGERITAEVVASFEGAPDARFRELMTLLTRHLHEFVREARLSPPEWEAAVDFLTDVGRWCTDTRQECILLSNVLGVSSLVETLNGPACRDRDRAGDKTGDQAGDHVADPAGDQVAERHPATEATVLGPFHLTESPPRALGDSIDQLGGGRSCVLSGQVVGVGGEPLAGAVLDVWQCTEDGFYDVQQPGTQPTGNGRGLFRTDDHGRFWFRTVVPSHYPIPTDGPVGRLLAAAARHPFRPAHVHVIASAPGYRPVTTHAFVAGSRYIDSDAVFAVKDSLLVEFTECHDPDAAAGFDVTVPFRHARFDLVLTLA
ncbi:MAG TPA: dioxygenase [Pseudonocardia sp.]|jgi:protocatechuate 3,4-dioxygenase beta subunit|nr:dioxygenase [Pseudonocardia sp.]